MHRDRSLSRRKLSIKELLGDFFPKKSPKSNDLVHESVEEYSRNHASSGMACFSSSSLKRNAEVKKDQGTSPYPTLANQQSGKVRKFSIYYELNYIV
jgi:lauroyl/myristoyl acyltransferase